MRYIKYFFILVILIGSLSLASKVRAETSPSSYQLLAPLPCPETPGVANPDCVGGKLQSFNAAQDKNIIGVYLNVMIKIFIGLCAVLSVVMIVVGGVEYMTSELSHTKAAGKERIEHAILGLIIALGAYALLFTINPDLLISDPVISNVTPPAASQPGLNAGTTPARDPNTLMGTCVYTIKGNPTPITTTLTEKDCNTFISSDPDRTKVSWNVTFQGTGAGTTY